MKRFMRTVVVGVALSVPAQAQLCSPVWSSEFPAGDVDGVIRSSLAADLGEGPRLYIGGAFLQVGGIPSPGVGAFDGHEFHAVGPGLPQVDTIYSLSAAVEDGRPVLYAGGLFKDGQHRWGAVMRWDGAAWSQVGGEFSDSIRALASFDDGIGPGLYAAGFFDDVKGQTPGGVARWDGTQWVLVGGGLVGEGYSLAVWDDGRGPALYVGGAFKAAGGVQANGIARWDGHAWEPLGAGLAGHEAYGLALRVWDDGTGEGLYVGGWFETAGGIAASDIARWDGHQWSAMGLGLDGGAAFINALAVFDDGEGEHLYAAGPGLSLLPDGSRARVARWNGESWDNGGLVFPGEIPRTLAVYKGALYIGGEFDRFFGVPVGTNLLRLASGILGQAGNGLLGSYPKTCGAYALSRADLGHGSELFVAGQFDSAGTIQSPNGYDYDSGIARWDGAAWQSLGRGVGGTGLALSRFDGGHSLVVGGDFVPLNEGQTENLSRWDGAGWLPVKAVGPEFISALGHFDDGLGPALFVGGRFGVIGGEYRNQIARWNGFGWSSLGGGLTGPGDLSTRAMCVFDDGSGPALFVTGEFATAGDHPAANIAKWDAFDWTALASGLDGAGRALCVFDDGSGPALYVGGSFTRAGGQAASNLARWDGQWSPVGAGTDGEVLALAVFDDGSGPALYIGGTFTQAGGQAAANLARFDGDAWSGQGLEADGPVRALLPEWEGGRGVLWVGGSFLTAGGVSSGRIAKLQGCACYADFDGSGELDMTDFILFQSQFAAEAERADCDASGSWDLFDFLCFLNAFNAGC